MVTGNGSLYLINEKTPKRDRISFGGFAICLS